MIKNIHKSQCNRSSDYTFFSNETWFYPLVIDWMEADLNAVKQMISD